MRSSLVSERAGRRSPSWLATAFELPGELDTNALKTALLAWIDRHEALRSGLFCTEGKMARITLNPGSVALHGKVAGDFAHGAELAGYLEDLFDAETDPLAWPSYVFATVTHADSTTLYLGLDHSNVDGYSISLIAHEIRELYAAAVAGGAAELAEVGSYVDFASLEREDAVRVHSDHETVCRWREFVSSNGGELPGFPAPVGADDPAAVTKQSGGFDWLLDVAEAKAFDTACRKSGGNFQAGVLACLAIAGHEDTGRREFRALAPFHTRNQARWAHSLGWYVGLAPLDFRVTSGGFHHVMRDAAAAAEQARPMAAVPFARVTELLGVPLDPRFVVSYMDLRHAPGAKQWPEWKAAALRSRTPHADEVYLWVNRSFEGVYLASRYPGTELGRTAVPRYVERVRRIMRQVAAKGSYAVAGLAAHTAS
ncbi:condensation domain-containing protein [Amycolatopsis anabasis]|uniref:condensation domain-containing protein n=1 Tax=Amycolatopsis anabasis TaxID=1840409 RepID=UPI00131EAAB3|nr:condensation domain-containing protein [Amycolatopsis anabasis]